MLKLLLRCKNCQGRHCLATTISKRGQQSFKNNTLFPFSKEGKYFGSTIHEAVKYCTSKTNCWWSACMCLCSRREFLFYSDLYIQHKWKGADSHRSQQYTALSMIWVTKDLPIKSAHAITSPLQPALESFLLCYWWWRVLRYLPLDTSKYF